MTITKLWTQVCSFHDLDNLTSKVVAELSSPDTPKPFCLWLSGPLGAGKTTIVGQLLRKLGLPELMPVTSPTYTYMNEYQIGTRWFAHLDLYRTKESLYSEDLGLADARSYDGFFVEWPEKKINDPFLQPTHTLTIEFGTKLDERVFHFARQ